MKAKEQPNPKRIWTLRVKKKYNLKILEVYPIKQARIKENNNQIVEGHVIW